MNKLKYETSVIYFAWYKYWLKFKYETNGIQT